jgi:hypothetical protein
VITPEEANSLKPSEIRWLKAAEKTIDQSLRASFIGQNLSIRVERLAGNDRVQALLGEAYRRNNWNVSWRSSSEQVYYDFNAPVKMPVWSADQKEEPKETPDERPTVWDRVNDEDPK